MKILAVFLMVFALTMGAIATVTRPDDSVKHSTLADQINSACKPGYRVNDWTSGDEFEPLPPGQVKVTCARVKEPYDLYYVAVER